MRWPLIIVLTLAGFALSVGTALVAGLWSVHYWNLQTFWHFAGVSAAIAAFCIILFGVLLRLFVRNGCRFGTRSALVAITMLAVLFGLVGQQLHRTWKRQRTIAELMQHGGTVAVWAMEPYKPNWMDRQFGYDPFREVDHIETDDDRTLGWLIDHRDQFRDLKYISFGNVSDSGFKRANELNQFPTLKTADLFSQQITDEGLRRFCGWIELEGLCISDCTQITDAGMAHLENLSKLELLFVLSQRSGRQKISDASLIAIGRLKNLKRLIIADAPITDAGIAYLEGLQQLEVLSLRQVDLSDDGLKSVAKLGSLETLILDGLNISDDGIQWLKQLKKLTRLNVEGTKVSEVGVREFQAALPDCKIVSDISSQP